MTLVQACVAENGNSIILLADRLLTSRLSDDLPAYEFEAKRHKIFHKDRVGIGFAGASIYSDMASSLIVDKTDFDDIAEIISSFIQNKRSDIVDTTVKRLTGVDANEFFTNRELPIPNDVRGFLYSKIGEFTLDCHCVIAGFDKNDKARLVVTDSNGDKIETTNFGFFSIGTGSPFSKVYFDQYGYETEMGTKEAILFAFEAKKWAQAHTGVGDNTDILVFKKIEKDDEKDYKVISIYDDSDLMTRLKNTYQSEIEKKKSIRDKLLKELFKEGDGI